MTRYLEKFEYFRHFFKLKFKIQSIHQLIQITLNQSFCEDLMKQSLPYIIYFLCWLIALTFALGALGMLLPQVFSMLVLLPYMISFYLMARHFVKKMKDAPDMTTRWYLSIGCATAFWFYSIIAGIVGIFLLQGGVDFAPIAHALSSTAFVFVFLSIFLMVNAFLVLLGFWFLGKPTQMMLKKYQK